MPEPPRKRLPELRIRAVQAWTAEHGREAPHLTIPAAEKAERARLAEVIEYLTAWARLRSQGQKSVCRYRHADGGVQADRPLDDGDRQVLAFYWPGDVFGHA